MVIIPNVLLSPVTEKNKRYHQRQSERKPESFDRKREETKRKDCCGGQIIDLIDQSVAMEQKYNGGAGQKDHPNAKHQSKFKPPGSHMKGIIGQPVF